MDAIFFVLRTGCQWGALDATGLCAHSAAHRRFQAWTEADVFVALWEQGLGEYDALQGMDWEWLAMDDAMPKAPLGGKRWAGAGVAAGDARAEGLPTPPMPGPGDYECRYASTPSRRCSWSI
jgi:transposase